MSNNLFDLNFLEVINSEGNNSNLVKIARNSVSCKTLDPFSSNNYENIAKIEEEKISNKFKEAGKCNTITTLDYADIYKNECFYKKLL
ncbi:hypothetical protein D7V90_20655 [bacterium 1xD42-87]|nr:hypothetical protein D7V90_20655 [bacterium 1xD42-87]